jgi:hypothetical protein
VSTEDSGALAPIAAISAALADYEDCTQGAKAWIHVPGIVAPHLSTHGFFERKGDKLVTPEGHIVVPGPGYPNGAGAWGPYTADLPPGPGQDGYNAGTYDDDLTAYLASGTVADDGEVWVYVTGPVEASDPHYLPPDTAKEQRHARMQETLVTTRAVTIARFDPACVFASLVTIPATA